MNIGFDAKRAFRNNTGLGNYSRSLIKAIQKIAPENDYQLFTPKNNPIPQAHFFNEAQQYSIITPKNNSNSTYWRSFSIQKEIQQYKTQIFHGLSNEIPFTLSKTDVKSVVTIHDLIYKRYPQYYGFFDRIIYNYKVNFACQHADKIIAISQQTKRDLIHYYHADPNKIEVVYQDCDENFKQVIANSQLEAIRNKYHLPSEFILNVGTIEDRKNVLLVIKALLDLPKDIVLVIVGKSKSYRKEVDAFIKEHQLEDRIILLQDIIFQDLPAIYQLAKVFVYPSKFEGFGIPIIEAIHSNLPVIAATGSCLEEAGGPDNLYVDPNDAKTLAIYIQKLWEDPILRAQIVSKSKVYVQQFNFENIAHQMIQIYSQLIKA